MYSCFGYNLGASLRNSSEIGRLPCKVNNKNTYEDGDSLTTKGQVKATKGALKLVITTLTITIVSYNS